MTNQQSHTKKNAFLRVLCPLLLIALTLTAFALTAQAGQTDFAAPPTSLDEDSAFWSNPGNWPTHIHSESAEYRLYCKQIIDDGRAKPIHHTQIQNLGTRASAGYTITKESYDSLTNKTGNPLQVSRYGPAYTWRSDGTVYHKLFTKTSGDHESHTFDKDGILVHSVYTYSSSNIFKGISYNDKGHPFAEVHGILNSPITAEPSDEFLIEGQVVSKDEYDAATSHFRKTFEKRVAYE